MIMPGKKLAMAKAPTKTNQPLVLLMGVADNGRELVELGKNGQMRIVFMGTCSYLPYLSSGRFDVRKLIMSPASSGLPALPPGPVVNYIADPDSHSLTLAKVKKLLERMGNPRCFNPPQAVMQTRRDRLADLLQGIAGVRMPRTLRLEPRHPREFAESARASRLNYPLIVRLAGTHNGISMVRIEDAKGWDAVHALPWQGGAVYLTEYVDCRDSGDGLYRKHRLVVVGGKPFLLHVYISSEWNVHRKVSLDTPEALAEELGRLGSFDRDLLTRIKPALDEIHERIGLDFYGIDCHVGPDSTLTIFEANPAMNVLQPVPALRQRGRARIQRALENRLSRFARPGKPA
jgi:glutathione synthase/RimK-type ligase-like ATP-grasp enzyme